MGKLVNTISVTILLCLALGADSSATSDAFWIFSKDGVKAYSKDGTKLVNNLSSKDICVKPAMTSKLTHGDGAPGDNFGRSVQISGDTAVVGAYGHMSNQGSAYVYVRSSRSGTWSQQAKLQHFDGQAGHAFAVYTALEGDTAVVGAVGVSKDADNKYSGAAYVYVRNGKDWTMQQKLTADDGVKLDRFGTAVSLSGNTAVFGSFAACTDGQTGACGAAYVFVRTGVTWTLQQKLLASDSHPGSNFGFEVKVDGNTAVVGAPKGHPTDSPTMKTGTAFVFVRSGTTWLEQQKLSPSDGSDGDYFGRSVGLAGDTLIVGSSRHDGRKGAAYIYARSGATWKLQQKIVNTIGEANDGFGGEVAISGGTVLIGSSGAGTRRGHAHVYVRDGVAWKLQKKLIASDGAMNDQFSRDMDISGDIVLVGAPKDDKPSHNGPSTGSVSVFVRKGSDWSDGTEASCGFKDAATDGQKYVYASNTQSGSFVEVFSIAHSTHVGSIPTCNFPYYLTSVPYREEVWVHCWSPESTKGDEGHLDVFSTNALGFDHKQVNLNTPLKVHAHGVVKMISTVPNYAYATLLDVPALQRVNVHTKETTTLWLNRSITENCVGFYRMAMSPLNRHVFLRCYVCCSCGTDGDTGKECSSRAGQVTLADGTTTKGHCGHSCEGTKADNVGVLEYDLIGERPVGTHMLPGSVGTANPYVSPKGDFLVMLSNDGAAAKIIQIGSNGILSNDEAASDVQLGFQSGGTANTISDVAFIEDDTYDLVIFTSTMDDYIVVANLHAIRNGANSVPSSQIYLGASSGHGRGARRMAVWAEGSRYVMINSNKDEKVHIIDLGSTGSHTDVTLANTLDNTPSTVIVYTPALLPKGRKGAQGLSGSPGLQGSQGVRGQQGFPGEQGIKGERGIEGDENPNTVLLVVAIAAVLVALMSLFLAALAFGKIKAMGNQSSKQGAPDGTPVGRQSQETRALSPRREEPQI